MDGETDPAKHRRNPVTPCVSEYLGREACGYVDSFGSFFQRVVRVSLEERASWPEDRRAREERAWKALVEIESDFVRYCFQYESLTSADRERLGSYYDIRRARENAEQRYRRYQDWERTKERERRYQRKAIVPAVRRAVVAEWEASGRRCGICGKVVQPGERTALDHIVPVRRGGTDAAENLRVAHFSCNSRRGPWYFAPGVTLEDACLMTSTGSSVRVCYVCRADTWTYYEIPGFPKLWVCAAHSDRASLRGLLIARGVPDRVLL